MKLDIVSLSVHRLVNILSATLPYPIISYMNDDVPSAIVLMTFAPMLSHTLTSNSTTIMF